MGLSPWAAAAPLPVVSLSPTNTTPMDKTLGVKPFRPNIAPPEQFSPARVPQLAQSPEPIAPTETLPTQPNIPAPSATPTGRLASPAQQPISPATDSAGQIQVNRIEVVGSTVFSQAKLAALTHPFAGRSLTLEELRQVADAITQLYLEQGYLTSRAVLVEQVVEQGVVQIRVVEGSLETIRIEGNQRVRTAYIRDRIQLGVGTPLHQGRLEDQLRLLRIDPLFDSVEASLRAGSGLGQSILTVRVTEADPIVGGVSADNYSTASVGAERLGIVLGHRNLTGNGDMISGAFYRSTTGGSHVFDLSYRLPVNPMNGTLELRVAPNRYRITDPTFAALDIRGHAELYELSFRQPLVRSPRQEFALSIGFTHRQGETLISDLQVDSSTTSVIQLGQDYLRRDAQGAWSVRSQFNIGTGLLDATVERNPDGQFFSWQGQFQRAQILDPNHLLIVQAEVQLTADALLPAQQFVIGGGQSVRGYRQNARLGDNGLRFSVENRWTLARDAVGSPTFQLTPFIDLGTVWNDDSHPTATPDQSFLLSTGIGLWWEMAPDLNLRVDYGIPLVQLGDRGNNAQDEGVSFGVNYQF
jgi:hemolysin activation/secretion protein